MKVLKIQHGMPVLVLWKSGRINLVLVLFSKFSPSVTHQIHLNILIEAAPIPLSGDDIIFMFLGSVSSGY